MRPSVVLAAALLTLSVPAAARDTAAFAQVVQVFRSGDARAARSQVAKLVERDRDWAAAVALEGRIALALREGPVAENKLRRAIALGYPAPALRHLLAHAYVLQGRFPAALTEASDDAIPPRYAAYAARMRAAAFASLGRQGDAFAALEAALRIAPADSHVWSDRARLRLYAGDIAGASTAAERAVSLDPANVEALTVSGILVRSRYGLAAALPWFDRALVVEPGNLAAQLERAATLGDLGRARDMLAASRAILADYPDNAQAFYLQAVLAARAGDWSLARSLAYRIGDRLGELPGLQLLGATIDLAQGNSEPAIAKLRLLVDAQPDNAKARRLLGSALWRSGDDRGAIDALAPLAERPDADSYTLTLIGRAHERIGERAQAAAYLDRAAAPQRGSATPFDGDASRPIDGGLVSVPYIRELLATGRAADATAEAMRLRRASPGSPATALIVGDTLAAQQRWGEAAAAYRAAANLRFSEGTALRLVDALRRSDDAPAASRVVELYLAQNPRSVAAGLLASDLSLSSGDWARAASVLEELRRRLGDRDATVLNNLGWARLNLGDTRAAIDLGRAAYALNPRSAPVAASYGQFLIAGGDRDRGIALIEKAIAIAPNDPRYAEKLAQVRTTS